MTELQALIAELEQAEEGSRELDARIAVLGKCGWVANHTLDRGRVVGWFYDGVTLASQKRARHYTTSLDAALTLVPGGCRWAVGVYEDESEYFAACQPDELTQEGFDGTVGVATPALCLCIAALRARASGEAGG